MRVRAPPRAPTSPPSIQVRFDARSSSAALPALDEVTRWQIQRDLPHLMDLSGKRARTCCPHSSSAGALLADEEKCGAADEKDARTPDRLPQERVSRELDGHRRGRAVAAQQHRLGRYLRRHAAKRGQDGALVAAGKVRAAMASASLCFRANARARAA